MLLTGHDSDFRGEVRIERDSAYRTGLYFHSQITTRWEDSCDFYFVWALPPPPPRSPTCSPFHRHRSETQAWAPGTTATTGSQWYRRPAAMPDHKEYLIPSRHIQILWSRRKRWNVGKDARGNAHEVISRCVYPQLMQIYTSWNCVIWKWKRHVRIKFS